MNLVTASALKRNCGAPRAFARIPARTPDEKKREANRIASAAKGTQGHSLIEGWAKSGTRVPGEDAEMNGYLDLLAAQWSPPASFEAEVAWGLTHDGNYREVEVPEPHVYVAKDGTPLLTGGMADGVWTANIEKRIMCVIDWKFGKWPVEPARTNLQVNAAGMALALKEFALAYVPGIYYARDGVFDWGDIVALGSPEWQQRLDEVREAALMDETPRPGSHCAACWDRKRCPAAETP